MEKIIIASVSRNGIIGANGKIPWHCKDELIFFKKTTMGFPVIMGRKTFDSLNKILPGRLNIVITRTKNKTNNNENIMIFNSLQKGIDYCKSQSFAKVFIIGGAEIYKAALNTVDKMIISKMVKNYQGDVYFPKVSWELWNEKLLETYPDFVVYEYSRITN